MKSTVCYSTRYQAHHAPSFPNGMTRREFFGKVLDLLLVAASGMGIAAIVALLLVLF